LKLLFLDIDGVLNSFRSDLVLGNEHTVENLDPIAVELVRKVVEITGCVICLSSEWRYKHDFMELGKKLKLPIMFETEHTRSNRGHGEESRAEEIQKVVDELKPDVYAILDDDDYEHEFEGMPMVNVANECGFNYGDYQLLLELLGKDFYKEV